MTFFSHLKGVPHPQGNPVPGASKVFLARIATTGIVVWLMQTFTFFRRDPGAARNRWGRSERWRMPAIRVRRPQRVVRQLPVIFLSGILCTALAFCCDDWPEDTDGPIWLRPVEAAGCGCGVRNLAPLFWALAAGFDGDVHGSDDRSMDLPAKRDRRSDRWIRTAHIPFRPSRCGRERKGGLACRLQRSDSNASVAPPQ
jgi:hypothetical protein